MNMIDYKQTVEDFKKNFEKRLKGFLNKHKDSGVDSLDFIYAEIEIWQEVEFVLMTGGSRYQATFDNIYPNREKILNAKESLGEDGGDILKWKSRAIDAYLNDELEKYKSQPSLQEKEYDNNFWNDRCYNLFKYLIDNYNKDANVKYINIYYFLEGISKDKKEVYRFNMRIDKDYKPLIKRLFNVTITKFSKAQFAYGDKEVPILTDLEKKFIKLPN